MDVQFSSHCGENVELSNKKNKASWRHRFSGGIAFSAQQLTNTTKLKLDLAGTGHVYIGIITHDPASITNMRETLSRDVLVAKEIRVHKRLAPVNIFVSTKEERRCIVFEWSGETQFKNVETYTNVWLFVYIKFGDLIALLRKFYEYKYMYLLKILHIESERLWLWFLTPLSTIFQLHHGY
jgi:hypothetical protein